MGEHQSIGFVGGACTAKEIGMDLSPELRYPAMLELYPRMSIVLIFYCPCTENSACIQ